MVDMGVVCVEDDSERNSFSRETTVFKMDQHLSYPGNCRLELSGPQVIDSYLERALCDDSYGKTVLSSDLFMARIEIPIFAGRVGQSLPDSIGPFNQDLVKAFCCICPEILNKWASRPRYWPPQNIVQKVVSLGAFVTPVGFKGSEFKHMEWRICFNTGETELINNLNETQVKLYVLLKMVGIDVLKPRKKEVTSFTLKNIVLWMAEQPTSIVSRKKIGPLAS
ncbi:hypothetical protein DPMN_037896 [Dreissena polymorpha]|uniref:Mab-21-like nucleotidyltransferase domain-containing protein n=1 Tax=Dreissena polymorpha TaxID=45954 RepID=A0A9D4MEE9_DREPO|nr:hypothetical protein DPMN_037896 [Dreissena polymorpha]